MILPGRIAIIAPPCIDQVSDFPLPVLLDKLKGIHPAMAHLPVYPKLVWSPGTGQRTVGLDFKTFYFFLEVDCRGKKEEGGEEGEEEESVNKVEWEEGEENQEESEAAKGSNLKEAC